MACHFNEICFAFRLTPGFYLQRVKEILGRYGRDIQPDMLIRRKDSVGLVSFAFQFQEIHNKYFGMTMEIEIKHNIINHYEI